jgi:hypothetical protein
VRRVHGDGVRFIDLGSKTVVTGSNKCDFRT